MSGRVHGFQDAFAGLEPITVVEHPERPECPVLRPVFRGRPANEFGAGPGGLAAADFLRRAGIQVPTLCHLAGLTPTGACRMCVVEIEGMRGYPLACSTIATEGMRVLTDTAVLREMRTEILKLILSEHPASCLICDEREECRGSGRTPPRFPRTGLRPQTPTIA